MKTESLYFKINAAAGIISIVIALIFGAVLYPFEIRRYHLHIKNIGLLLDTVFQNKYEDIANELFAGQKRALAVTLGKILKVEGITKVCVYMPDGELFLTTDQTVSDRITAPELKSLENSFSFVISEHKDRSLRIYSRKIEAAGEKIGYIKLYYDLSELSNEIRLTVFIFLTLLLTTLFLVSFLLNLFLSRFVIKPIFLLRNAIRKVEQGHLGETVCFTSEDEIGDLGAAFNRMSVRLHESQSAIRKAEEKYRGIFENAMEGIFQSRPEGTFISANPSLARILGYDSPEELMESVSDIGKQIYAVPEQRKELLSLLEQYDLIPNYECQFRRRDGSIIWGMFQIRAFRDHTGRLTRTEGLLEDISERKQALENLRASEKKFRELYEGSRDGYAMTDMRGRFLECNSAFCEMTGYTPEALQALTYPDIRPEKHRETESELLTNQAVKRGYTDVYETEIIRKDGTVFPVESRVHLIRNEEGCPAGFWGFIRDISEKKKLQAEAMLQARLASIGELAAGVAHEINNPVNGIINYAQILINRSKGGDDEIPKRIIKEGDRIEKIVRSLLSFAREQKEKKSRIRIQDVLSESMELTGAQLRKDHIRVISDIPDDLPMITANLQQIQQVFMNLIGNARYALNKKYAHPSPDKQIEITGETAAYENVLTVRITFYDRGTGIPSNIINRICDPFFSTKPGNEGTGLGLSISHGIIKDHGGRLWFESEEGVYSKAVAELPAACRVGMKKSPLEGGRGVSPAERYTRSEKHPGKNTPLPPSRGD